MATEVESFTILASESARAPDGTRNPQNREIVNYCHDPCLSDLSRSLIRWLSFKISHPSDFLKDILFRITMTFGIPPSSIMANCNYLGFKLEKEMATHSSVLAWRIPGTGEPGGLPSMVTQFGHE